VIEAAYLAEVAAGSWHGKGHDPLVDRLREEVVRFIDAEVEKCKKLHLAEDCNDVTPVESAA
jgi:hypothetical protein